MNKPIAKLNRRDFLRASGYAGGGLLLGASFESAARAVPVDIVSGAASEAEFLRLNLFVELALDGTVRIVCHRSEMGQGIRTGLPQVLADEMGADWARVQVIQGQANSDYGSQNTDGSRSVRDFYLPMRRMGAAAREMLRLAAAKQWGLSGEAAAQIRVAGHRVSGPGKRELGFAELAKAAAEQPLPELAKLPLKAAKDFRYIGISVGLVEMPELLSGRAEFGVDVELPGMVHASIERCPVLGGQLKSVDASAALKQKGVIGIEQIKGQPLPAGFNALPGVAVIANSTWAAQQGRKLLKLDWDLGANANAEQGDYPSVKNLAASKPYMSKGDVAAAMAGAKQRHRAEYRLPYLAHAPMEPPAATAVFSDKGCEVWACSQTPQAAQREVAKALGLKTQQVTIHVTYLGGGFGRKSKPDFAVEAALLAKALGRPVKVTWSREDDIRFDYLHAISAMALEAGLDASGNISAWRAAAALPSIGSTFGPADAQASWEFDQGFNDLPFAIDNIELRRLPAPANVRIGWLRSVINIPLGFAVGSFSDELARLAGKDTPDFLTEAIGADRNLKPLTPNYSNYGKDLGEYPMQTARAKAVIERLKKLARWREDKSPGIGYGMCYHYSFLSHVAVAAKMRWQDGQPQLLALYCVCDAGQVVNPDRVKSQLEGAMVFGTSIALYSEISTAAGQVEQNNFDGYRLTRINECPEIEVDIVAASDAPRGVGEPGVPPVAPAIANALVDAGGPRVRQLPLFKHLPKA